MTVTELKQQFADHLAGMDKNKMSMMDLNVYVNILQILDNMDKPDRVDTLMDICKRMYKDPEPVTLTAVDYNFPVKGGSDNG